jgi:serine/threonine protein phosphatase 1
MRQLVIGDIHGGLKALIQCLIRANFDLKKDQLIFLGDYVDGWSESAGVIEYLIRLQEDSFHQHIFIKGNHDEWASRWINLGQISPMWKQEGGQATIDSYIIADKPYKLEEHSKFFRDLRNYYWDTDNNRVFVHGGYISRDGIEGERNVETDYYWDRELWYIALSGATIFRGKVNIDTRLPARLRPHKEIFIGHTSTTQWDKDIPMKACNVWNLDTGAAWDGKLTIMDVETKQYWQSDKVSELYAGEKGRRQVGA